MFGFGQPKSPVSTYHKAWVEYQMRWLVDEYGWERLRDVEVTLPTGAFFAHSFTGSPEDTLPILDQLCDIMDVDRKCVRLPFEESAESVRVINLTHEALHDPEELIAVLAHQLASAKLVAAGLPDDYATTFGSIADLTPVLYGLGVFSANATIRVRKENLLTEESWTARRIGFLPSHVFGYALGLFAWLRGEPSPDWARYLRHDAATACRQTIKYLAKTDDSILRPDNLRERKEENSLELRRQLREGSPSSRLTAMWEIGVHRVDDTSILEALTQCLTHPDPALRSQAARTMISLETIPGEAVPLLMNNLNDREPLVRAAAAATLRVQPTHLEDLAGELAHLLTERNSHVVLEAAKTLEAIGLNAKSARPALLKAIQKWLIDGESRIDQLFLTLLAIDENPDATLREHFSDAELLYLAEQALNDCREHLDTQD